MHRLLQCISWTVFGIKSSCALYFVVAKMGPCIQFCICRPDALCLVPIKILCTTPPPLSEPRCKSGDGGSYCFTTITVSLVRDGKTLMTSVPYFLADPPRFFFSHPFPSISRPKVAIAMLGISCNMLEAGMNIAWLLSVSLLYLGETLSHFDFEDPCGQFIESTLWLCQTVCYWKWPSRNSRFAQL